LKKEVVLLQAELKADMRSLSAQRSGTGRSRQELLEVQLSKIKKLMGTLADKKVNSFLETLNK
jgi:hypothetical protein